MSRRGENIYKRKDVEHSANVPFSIHFTLLEIIAENKLSQYANACSPISETLSGITIDDSFPQLRKAFSSILVMLFGMTMEVNS